MIIASTKVTGTSDRFYLRVVKRNGCKYIWWQTTQGLFRPFHYAHLDEAGRPNNYETINNIQIARVSE
jgi:hypothetical protein